MLPQRTRPRRLRPFVTAASLALLAGVACESVEVPGPEMILTGGRIYADANAAPVAALAIDGDRIVAIGSDAEIRAMAVEDSQEMALDGATVLPGLVDAWVDLESLGRDDRLDLVGTVTPREVQARLRAGLGDGPGWLLGFGWDETVWPRREVPTAEMLDAVTGERPTALYRRVGHVAWLNTAALRNAGVADAVLPAADGSRTGLVTGDALRRVEAALPAPDPADRELWIAAGARSVAAVGITRVMTSPLDIVGLESIRRLRTSGDLPIRVEPRVRAGQLPDGDPDPDRDRVAALGIDVDGPFSLDLASLSGTSIGASPARAWADVEAACDEATRRGLEIHAHVYGDAAFEAVAPCVARIGGLVVGGDLLPAAGIPEGVRLATVPMRLAHDLYWLEERLGPRRVERAHAYRDMAGARLLRGMASRAPEYPLAPMQAVRIVNRRQDADGFPRDGWQSEQRLTIPDALQAAMGTFLGTGWGRLEAGGPADLVVWSEDPMEGAEALRRTQAMVAIVGGRVVYSRPLIDVPLQRR